MATFVHNEPTCLGVLQENGLPESLYRVVESGLEPAIEVRSITHARCCNSHSICTGHPSYSECNRRPLSQPSWSRPACSPSKHCTQPLYDIRLRTSPARPSRKGKRRSHWYCHRRTNSASSSAENCCFSTPSRRHSRRSRSWETHTNLRTT